MSQMPKPHRLNAMSYAVALEHPKFRRIRDGAPPAVQPQWQVRVGWWWRSCRFPKRWNFTTNLTNRSYPSDAVFVPMWTDVFPGEGEWL